MNVFIMQPDETLVLGLGDLNWVFSGVFSD